MASTYSRPLTCLERDCKWECLSTAVYIMYSKHTKGKRYVGEITQFVNVSEWQVWIHGEVYIREKETGREHQLQHLACFIKQEANQNGDRKQRPKTEELQHVPYSLHSCQLHCGSPAGSGPCHLLCSLPSCQHRVGNQDRCH